MTLQEAIVARHSVRQYIEKPIEAGIVELLKEERTVPWKSLLIIF